MARACARHILVKIKEQADSLKQELKKGANFAALTKKHSQCTSAKKVVTSVNLALVRW